MADTHIIDSVKLNHKGLCTLDETHKWVKLHKRQGDLDGACAIYSIVMAMLCKGLLQKMIQRYIIDQTEELTKVSFYINFSTKEV